jgi:hypothetical protein
MSAGLALARDVIGREGMRHPVVLLLSDLGYSPDDAPAIVAMLAELRERGVDLRLMPLSHNRSNFAFFRHLLEGRDDLALPPQLKPLQPRKPPHDGPPRTFVLLGAGLLALLALNELWCGRLTWRTA